MAESGAEVETEASVVTLAYSGGMYNVVLFTALYAAHRMIPE